MTIEEFSNLAQGIAAVLAVFAIVPSVVIFFLNQREQLRMARDSNHRYAIERYRDFLDVCLTYPELSLESGNPRADVDAMTRARRDIAFDILTSTFERAYMTYEVGQEKAAKEQWKGWRAYILFYCERPDYLEWIRRYIFENNEDKFFKSDQTQYDSRFEAFLFALMKPFFNELEMNGTLQSFAPRKP